MSCAPLDFVFGQMQREGWTTGRWISHTHNHKKIKHYATAEVYVSRALACTAVTNAADKPMLIADEAGYALGPFDSSAKSSLVESQPKPVIATDIPDTKEKTPCAISSVAMFPYLPAPHLRRGVG